MYGASDLNINRLQLFSSCPALDDADPAAYRKRVADVAVWSERAGCRGLLIFTANSEVDPWLLAHIVIQSTTALCPLVAVQPVYMHPYTLAKIVASLAFLYGRRVYLNMVAGGFKNDLVALQDSTAHDERYSRLIEFTTIVRRLLLEHEPISFQGKFYGVERLKLSPPIPETLCPEIFVSGSSEAGMAAARAIRATAIQYPNTAANDQALPAEHLIDSGIRVGIISRPTEQEAWAVALDRFPEDRKGQLTHRLAMKVSDSVWHQRLSDLAETKERSVYWLVPFQNYKTMCPYLVGSYEHVAQELARYLRLGCRTYILDVPTDGMELFHTRQAFDKALDLLQTPA